MKKLKDIERLAQLDGDVPYDLHVFSSGFEDRSAHLVKFIEPSTIESIVLGFSGDRHTLSREQNDAQFRKLGMDPVTLENDALLLGPLQSKLQEAAQRAGTGRPLRIFVDYSTMTRTWYGHILTWAKYSKHHPNVVIDLFYSFGNYHKEFQPLHVRELSSVAGFEGHCAGARRTTALLGLGFDKYATLAVCDQIEPDSIICFVAQESSDDPHARRVLSENQEVIEASGRPGVPLPLGNVGEAFRMMYEQAAFCAADEELVAVPMGPKPHVLASLLLAQVLPRVTCLHARGHRADPVPVSATGQVSGCRLTYGA